MNSTYLFGVVLHDPQGLVRLMNGNSHFDEMVEACLKAGELAMLIGSPELQAAMQIVLFLLGQQIAARLPLDGAAIRGDPD